MIRILVSTILSFSMLTASNITAGNAGEILKGSQTITAFTKDGKIFTLKESYQPGNLGNLSMSSVSDDLLNKELKVVKFLKGIRLF